MDVIITLWKNSSYIKSYENWLLSPDGKRKPPRQAKQYCRQVELILKETSKGTFQYELLFDSKLIRENWIHDFEKVRKAGTIVNYLHSL